MGVSEPLWWIGMLSLYTGVKMFDKWDNEGKMLRAALFLIGGVGLFVVCAYIS